jgi:TolA-binding protein
VQKLASARQDVAESALSAKTPDATESIHLRLKLAELLMRLSQQKKERKAEGEISPSSQRRSRAQESESTKSSARKAKASPSEKALADKSTAGRPGSGDALHTSPAVKNPRPPERAPTNKRDLVPEGPVDPVALAQALYRTGDYEGALATYRLINPTSVDRPNRVGIQYMIATCLRKIGKKEEAATIYREVANSHDDNFLADCAKWQLSALEWRRDLETRLETLRNKNHPPEQKR